MVRCVAALVVILFLPAPAWAQLVTGTRLTIGPAPSPPSGSTVRITGAGATGGTGLLFTDAEGDLIKRALAKVDLPAGIAWVDQPNTFTALNTFSAGLNASSVGVTGALNVGGNAAITGTLAAGPTTINGTFTVGISGTERLRIEATRSIVLNTGTLAAWEFGAVGNADHQRYWRAGNVSGQFRIQGFNEVSATWSDLLRASGTAGVPDGIFLGAGVREITPAPYQTNLGRLTNKFLMLHAAELWVDTLVANDTMATIGGRILVGPTTTLTQDMSSAAGGVYVKHNNLALDDTIYLEGTNEAGAPRVEFMRVTAVLGACPAVCPPGTTGFAYSVARNLDGTAPDDWAAGDAIFNTGKIGNGFIDLYSVNSVRTHWDGTSAQIGPTIVGNVRTANSSPLAWAPRWAIGNLSGLYDYGAANVYGAAFGDPSDIWIATDATNGFRGMDGSTRRLLLHPSGYLVFGAEGATELNTYIDNENILMRQGAINRLALTPTALWLADAAGNRKTDIRADLVQFGDVDTGARITVQAASLRGYDPKNKLSLQVATGSIYLGDWYSPVTGATFLQIDSARIAMCAYPVGCPLDLRGNGDIYSNGNIYLTGGQIRSSGNFVLGDTQGMAFEQWQGTSYVANRSIKFTRLNVPTAWLGQDSNGSLRIRSATVGSGTGIRLTLGESSTDPYGESGMFMTREVTGSLVVTNITLQATPYGAGAWNTRIQFSPIIIPSGGFNENYLGTNEYWWHRVYAVTYYASNQAGVTQDFYFRKADGVTNCSMQVRGGIIVSSSCL